LNYEFKEPLHISYRTVASARNILVRVETNEGVVGVGESAPLEP